MSITGVFACCENDRSNVMGKLFRDKSIEKVSSPEQLNDYIRVTSPSVWIVIIAMIVLLAGIITWSVLGKVTADNGDGTTKEIAPITFVTN